MHFCEKLQKTPSVGEQEVEANYSELIILFLRNRKTTKSLPVIKASGRDLLYINLHTIFMRRLLYACAVYVIIVQKNYQI